MHFACRLGRGVSLAISYNADHVFTAGVHQFS